MFDLAVIGAGPGGYVAAIRAAQLGMKVICLDKGPALGGTCLNVGCIPSKCLLEDTLHGKVDFPAMMKRKGEVVKGLTDGVANLFRHYKIEAAFGDVTFLNPNTLQVAERKIEPKSILLATGSEPIPLPILPFDEKKILSSTGALALSEVPKTMLIVGAGVIGVEIASVYQRLGTQVTLIEMLDYICPGLDATIQRALLSSLQKQGITFHLSTKLEHAEGTILNKTFSADVVLVAVGRRPYTAGLKLQEIGVTTTPKGFVQVDNNFRTSLPHIFAIGDLIEGPQLAHKASAEGVAVAEILAGKRPHLNYLAIPNVVYTHPEAAAVGMTEKEGRDAGLELIMGTSFMRGNPRSRCAGDLEGMVKVIGEKKSGRLIGLHILASHASEMIGEGMIAIEKNATVEDLASAAHAHPTLSEAIKEAAGSAIGHAIHQ